MTKAPDIQNKNMQCVKKRAAGSSGELREHSYLGTSPDGKLPLRPDTETASYLIAKAGSGRTSSVVVPHMISDAKGSTLDGIAGIYCRVSRRPDVIDDFGTTESDSDDAEIDKTRNPFFHQSSRKICK